MRDRCICCVVSVRKRENVKTETEVEKRVLLGMDWKEENNKESKKKKEKKKKVGKEKKKENKRLNLVFSRKNIKRGTAKIIIINIM